VNGGQLRHKFSGWTITASKAACTAPAMRSVMIALVVLLHTAITYGSLGNWFYHELRSSATFSCLILSLFTATKSSMITE
jgi:hypothetical protein